MEDFMTNINTVLYEAADRRTDKYWFVRNPFIPWGLIFFFWLFVKYIGPKFMENRKPYNVDKFILPYNLLQTYMNLDLCLKGVKVLSSDFNFFCQELTTGTSDIELHIIDGIYTYSIIKFLDLLDTVFMVFKKNFHQITFLHVYHHMMTASVSIMVTRFYPNGHLLFLGTLNCFVHTIMYFYYFITAKYPQYKKSMWWKKYITQLQLIQHVLTTIHNSVNLLNPNCGYPKSLLLLFTSQTVLMIYLFSKFYYNAYIKPKPPAKQS